MMGSPGTLHLLIGPVGAGKTTYAQQKTARTPGVFLDLDTWMVRLFAADPRPSENVMAWYLERRDRCRDLIWDVALSVLHCGSDVFLELGLLAAMERETFYAKARDEGLRLVVYLLDAPRAVRRERVAQRNRSSGPFVQIVPSEFFERASDAWQPPSELERTAWGIVDA
jgi:predicted kinase